MLKRGYKLFGILLLVSVIFTVSSFVVNAQKQTTCLNPLGKNFCDNYNPTDQCYCDSLCIQQGDCCSDYQSVCKGGSTGGGGGGGGTQVCGNGIREGNEVCDGSDLGGNTCSSLGYLQGQIKCQSNCVAFDTSGCVKQDTGSVPQPPYNLVASYKDSENIYINVELNWANVNGEYFNIYMNKDNGPFNPYTNTNAKSIAILGLGKNVKYGFYVTALNQYGESKPSNTVWVYVPSSGGEIIGSNITEVVTCVFEGSSKQEYCTKADSGFSQLVECGGVGYCSVKVSGKKGEQVTWKSSCGGYAYTTMDGVDEKVLFNCQSSNVIKCIDTDNGVNEFEFGKTYIDGTNDIHYDDCLYDQSNSLIEYSCFNNVIQKTQIQCKNGCKEGACLKQGQSQIKAHANKPYTTNNPFFLSASGFSENSIITSVNWNLGPKDNPCKFTTKQDKGSKVSSSVYSEIEVTCYTPGVKAFIVTFVDNKGNKAADQVSVYVDQGEKIYQQATTPTTTTTPTPTIQQPKSTSNSCQKRCGFYDPKESCQCDDVCKDYGDCCLDKAQICG